MYLQLSKCNLQNRCKHIRTRYLYGSISITNLWFIIITYCPCFFSVSVDLTLFLWWSNYSADDDLDNAIIPDSCIRLTTIWQITVDYKRPKDRADSGSDTHLNVNMITDRIEFVRSYGTCWSELLNRFFVLFQGIVPDFISGPTGPWFLAIEETSQFFGGLGPPVYC